MEKSLEQRRLEFLDETVKFYSEDVTRRSVNSHTGRCKYRFVGEDGVLKKCAIGRHLPDEKYNPNMDKSLAGSGSFSFEDIFKLLPSEIYELGPSFLSDVQILHDTHSDWEIGGLTEYGKFRYEQIKEEFCTIAK